MKKNKKATVALSALLAALFTVFTIAPAASVTVSAETCALAMPPVSEITNSEIRQCKNDLFFEDSYTLAENNYTLNYRYYSPAAAAEKVPLIVFLHGRGERGCDNDSQLDKAILRPFIENKNSKFYEAMVIAPQCPIKENNNGWVNLFTDDTLDYKNYSVDEIAESDECKAIAALIKNACEEKNADPDRVYLIGLSQGAMATWDLLARHSELFAAAVPIAGVGDPLKADIYADIPIYAFHGEQDTTVPYATATPKMYEAIHACGKNKMNFVAFTDGPHGIWEAAIVFKRNGELPALEDWLFAQTKKEPGKGCGSTMNAAGMSIVVLSALAALVFMAENKRRTEK